MGCTSSSSSSPIENNNQKQSIPSEISIPKNEQNEKQIINKNKEEKENLAKVNSTREEEKVTPSIQNSQSQLQSPTTQTQSQVQQQQPTPKSPSMNQSTNSSPIQSQSQSVPSPISLPVLSPPITPTEPLKTPISPVVTAKSPSITSKIENKLESVEIPQLTLPEKITLINTKLPNSEPFTFPQNNNSNNDNNNNNDNDTSDDGSELSRDSFEGNLVVNESSLNTHRSEDTSTVTSSTHGPEKVQIISSKEEFIYEYERWQPFVLWGQTNPGHMLPSDPGIYSDIEGTRFGDNPEDVSPAHPKWWHIITPYEPAEKVEDPWEYSVDFKNYEWHSTKQKKSFVRRRKLRRVVGDSRHHQSSLPQGITSFSSNTSMDRININPPPPTVKGNMKKSGGKLQSFNDRYFVLESNSNGSYLIYYLKYTDSPPYGNNERDRMNLKNCQMITSPEGHIVLTSKKGKIYVLDLNDHPDKEKWTQALQDHINYANSST